MTPDDVARRHAFSRTGYELIGYAEVGLPIYQLTLLAYTISHKKISPLDEFTLKCIDAGLSTIEEISNFLGLKPIIVKGILTSLIMNDDLSLSGAEGDIKQSLRITRKGKQTLAEAEISTPEERTFQIHFDGLLRRPLILNEILYAPKEIREYGWIEIPSIPSTRPQLKDLRIQEIEQIIRQIGRRAEENTRDILSIKRIDSGKLLFRQAVLLKFRAKASDSVQVAFAIDGRLIEEYERAFALGRGPDRIRLDKGNKAEIEKLARAIEEQTGRPIPSAEEQEQLKQRQSNAASMVAKAVTELSRAEGSEEIQKAEDQLREATDNLHESEAALEQLPVRSLSVYEHPPVMQRALKETKQRLMIISPWIRSSVVNRDFLIKLEELLKKQVQVYIGYGIGDGRVDAGAVTKLQSLAARYRHFRFKNFGNTHAKLLLCDCKFVCLGSFNWLSFRGDPESTFRDEQSFLISMPEVIESKFKEQVEIFETST